MPLLLARTAATKTSISIIVSIVSNSITVSIIVSNSSNSITLSIVNILISISVDFCRPVGLMTRFGSGCVETFPLLFLRLSSRIMQCTQIACSQQSHDALKHDFGSRQFSKGDGGGGGGGGCVRLFYIRDVQYVT